MSVEVTLDDSVDTYSTGASWSVDGNDTLSISDSSGNVLAQYNNWDSVSTDQFDASVDVPEVETPVEDATEPVEEPGTLPTPAPTPDIPVPPVSPAPIPVPEAPAVPITPEAPLNPPATPPSPTTTGA